MSTRPADLPRVVMVHAESVAPQAWRNGGGQTRQLLAWPARADWRLRISRADIDTDGPFSAFAQVERWFTVLQGAGVVLTFADRQHILKPGAAPLCFDGAAAPDCRLLGGATQDLNLMVRQGTGVMRAVQRRQSWSEPFAMRGLYTTLPGLVRGRQRTHGLDADTLLWIQPGGSDPWSFEPDTPASGANANVNAWWLGFTPKD